MRRRGFVVVLALFLAVPLGSLARPAFVLGAGNCQLDYQSWQAGWTSSETPATNPEGVSATMTYRSAASCQHGILIGPFAPAGYSGWLMLASTGSQGTPQFDEYAQAGFLFDGNPIGCMKHFAEYNFDDDPAHFRQLTGACVSDGEVHVPKVVYVTGTGGHVRMYIDSSLFLETNFCICNWVQPFRAIYSGEAHDSATDIPGLVGTKLDWSGMAIQQVNTQQWFDVCGHLTLYSAINSPRYSTDAVACDHDRSWTSQP